MEQAIFDMIFSKETIFFALFLYLFWVQTEEKKSQNVFILKQQGILEDLTQSYGKIADNQERLTERIEKIEIHIGTVRGDDNR